MIDRRNLFDKPLKSHMRTLIKLQQVKEMATQLVVCWIIIISINTLT